MPIIEALLYGKPVLARDIPVFRELAAPGVAYFAAADPAALAAEIEAFVAAPPVVAANDLLATASWACSAQQVAQAIGLTPE